MIDVSKLWSSERFHDATLLLSSDRSSLEQHRAALQETLDISCPERDTSEHNPKRRKLSANLEYEHSQTLAHPAAEIGASLLTILHPISGASTRSNRDVCTCTDTGMVVSDPEQSLVLKIPVHRFVLSSGSDYFDTAISTLIGESTGALGGAFGSSPPHLAHPIILVHEENVEAAAAVLCYLYTEKINSVHRTAPQLLKMLLIADRWMAPQCVTACCIAIATLPEDSLTLENVRAIFCPAQEPIPPSLVCSADFQVVLQAAQGKLLQIFGNIQTVVSSSTLTAQMLQLPAAAMVSLLSSDALTTDSEDSVLMMLSWWLADTQAECLHSRKTLHELQNTIRYSRLSPTYLFQISLQPCLSPNSYQLMDLSHFRLLTAAQAMLYCSQVKSACPAGWFKPKRRTTTTMCSITNTITLGLKICIKQLSNHLSLVQKMEEGGPSPTHFRTSKDHRGLSITLLLSSMTHKKKLWAGMCIRARLPKRDSMTELHQGFPCSFKISIHSNKPSQPRYTLSESTRFLGSDWGWPNFAQHASELPGDPTDLAWWDPFIIDGHVKLTAQFVDERSS